MQLGKLNPLGSVFGKIWISFWLSLILIVIAAYFVSFQAAKQYQVAPPAPRHIATLSNIVFPDLGFAGTDPARLALILTNYNDTARFQLYLVDDAYRMLGSPQPPSKN